MSKAVDNWVKQLTEEDMPVFSGTVSSVTTAVNSDRSSAVEVAQLILKDASLAGKLLRMANSAYFNPSAQQINTISRAVMVLGFDQVRALTLSLILVENLTHGANREMLVSEMANAFHAATQAQEIAKQKKEKRVEDIFVATLLSNIGNMAYWAFSEEQGDVLAEQLKTSDDQVKTQKELLGFSLDELTKKLSKSWTLSELLDDFLSGNNKEVTKFISYGKSIANAAEKGWDSEEAQNALEEVADVLGLDIEELEQQAFDNAKKAKEITKLYGSNDASQKIPQPAYKLTEQGSSVSDNAVVETEKEVDVDEPAAIELAKYPEPDTQVQLTIMQEITNAVQEQPSIGIILEMVLEGIHHGVGMDRAYFMLLTTDRKFLQCKYALGESADGLRKKFQIDIQRKENVFHQIVQNQKAMIVPGDPKKLNGTLAKKTIDTLGKPPYMVMPTIVKNKVIGVFIADRNASKREFNQQDFIAFQQFCQQANMGLSFLAMRG